MNTVKLFDCLLFVWVICLASCVPDTLELPDTTVIDPEINGTQVSIKSLQTAYQQAVNAGNSSITFTNTNTYIEGYVISTDEAGNFFKELIVQDAPENPEAGITILIDVNPLFTKYNPGRKVFIRLDGLSLGINGGVLSLGIIGEDSIERIPAPTEADYVVRTSVIDTIIPSVKTISQITANDINTLIQLPKAQFSENDVGLSYANEPSDQFDGDRLIESCSEDGGVLLFQTSTFSDFKSLQLPQGSGVLTAILLKDFFGNELSLRVRDPEDVAFDSDERCIPKPLDPNLEANTTFAAVRARFEQAGGYAPFRLDEDPLIIEGYVISSDESSNFFDELYIQNTPNVDDLGANNPRLGLRVILDKNDIYQNFPVGRKVYLKLNGLGVAIDAGVLSLGLQNVSKIEKIPAASLSSYLVSGQETEVIIPLQKTVEVLDEDDLNTLVLIDDMQFALSEVGLTYAGEVIDNFDGERSLESCTDTGDIRLFTSTFADFKSQIVDPDVGEIQAIYTTNFSGDENILTVRDLDDINFFEIRCDPPIVDCGIAKSSGTSILFSDDFETQTNGEPIIGNGWVNYSEEGSQLWEAYTDSGSNASLGISARMGSFMSGDSSTITWLITPRLNFDTQEAETVSFKTSNSFSDGSEMTVLFSYDWSGNPTTISEATWSVLNNAVIVSDDTFFGDWIPSGIIDLSCIEGAGYIGFRYTGSGNPDFDGTFELDEIEVRFE